MVLEASKRIGLSSLMLGLTFLFLLFSAWCGSINPYMPNFPLIKETFAMMLIFGVAIGQVGATVGIVLALIVLFVPTKCEPEEKELGAS